MTLYSSRGMRPVAKTLSPYNRWQVLVTVHVLHAGGVVVFGVDEANASTATTGAALLLRAVARF